MGSPAALAPGLWTVCSWPQPQLCHAMGLGATVGVAGCVVTCQCTLTLLALPPRYVDAVDHPEAGQQSSTATGAFLRAVLCVRNNQVGAWRVREGGKRLGLACMCAHGTLYAARTWGAVADDHP